MVVDTSALLAVFFEESEAEDFARAIAAADVARISAANLLQAGIVADNQTDLRTGRQLDALVANFRLRIEPVTEEQVRIARQAYVDFGRGNHPAGLNFGDCFAYALAKATGEPLLFTGDDFAPTSGPIARPAANLSPVLRPDLSSRPWPVLSHGPGRPSAGSARAGEVRRDGLGPRGTVLSSGCSWSGARLALGHGEGVVQPERHGAA
jgi:ribonuclease VapC